MSSTILLSVASLFYILIILITYFSKEKLDTSETRIYTQILLTSFLSLVSELFITLIPIIEGSLIFNISLKIYLILCVLWLSYFMEYVFIITRNDKNKIKINYKQDYKKIYKFFWIIVSIILLNILVLPIKYFNDKGMKYSYGPSVNLVFFLSAIYMIIMSFYIIKNIKSLKNKGYLPILFLIIFMSVIAIIQKTNPGLLLANTCFAIITSLMYHSIENPDMKLLTELENNRTLIESNNEEKSNLLFKISQEVRIPIKNIENVSSNMLNKKTKLDLIDDAKNINIEAKNLSLLVDNILDISNMDINKIKLYKNKFDINKLYNEIILITKNNLKNNIEFNTNIINNLPLLYGDSIKLKQIICSILNYSIKNTKKGYIELDIDAITNYDIARLIITIKDTGKFIELNEINEIMSYSNNEIINDNNLLMNLKEINNIVKILNGTFLIKSKKNEENIYRIIIDHELETNKKLTNILKDKKQVLLIDDNYEELKEYSKILKQYNIKVTTSMYGSDSINRIRNNEHFDLIIIDDEMQPYNAIKTLEELNKIPNFKTKVIIMLGLNKEFISEHYINDYKFKDFILKRKYKDELKRIVDKYL